MPCAFREVFVPSFNRVLVEEALEKLPGLFWRGKSGRESTFDFLLEYGDENRNKYRMSLYINEYHEASLFYGRFKRKDSGNWETTADDSDIDPIDRVRMNEMMNAMLDKIRSILRMEVDDD